MRDSVSDLVAIMQTYNAKGKISRLFMSTLFRRRQDEAEAVINHAISRLQVSSANRWRIALQLKYKGPIIATILRQRSDPHAEDIM